MADTVHLTSDAGRWIATLKDDRVTLDGDGTFMLQDAGDGRFTIRGSGDALSVSGARAGRSIWIGVNGHAIEFRLERLDEQAAAAGMDDASLRPPMAATVVRIAVTPGAHVAAGDTLVVLEAMKMELPIRAPRDGVVRSVTCAEGQLVQPEMLLVELEP
jgi:acetyl/propionyl-CoA carboxylase alpha subunit